MALEGNAGDFGLSEIFQLISIQKKSGMLSVSGDENMAIFFQDGLIASTRDRRARSRDPLKDYLLRYGFIGRDEMNNLQQIQARSKMDLTDILLQENGANATRGKDFNQLPAGISRICTTGNTSKVHVIINARHFNPIVTPRI